MAWGDGAVPAHVPSLTHIIRLHNEAVTGKIGNERVEHLEHCLKAIVSFLETASMNQLIDTEQIEEANEMKEQIMKDLQEARKSGHMIMPEDDGRI